MKLFYLTRTMQGFLYYLERAYPRGGYQWTRKKSDALKLTQAQADDVRAAAKANGIDAHTVPA